ncbi:metallophosphoesterase family protein [bacterium]|nr:metallophosphoesterase family protein [candidate division CSSED10-310 bacterium]
MKIGVIADTHLTKTSSVINSVKNMIRNKRTIGKLRTLVQEYFSDVDLIIHAGDFVELVVLEMLQEFAPVEAVHGNMDTAEIRHTLPAYKVLTLGGFSVGLIHGDGGPEGIMDRIKRHFNNVDAIIFGHTHHPINQQQEGILFFNPGSPTDRIFAPYNSLGLLEISDKIQASIIRV